MSLQSHRKDTPLGKEGSLSSDSDGCAFAGTKRSRGQHSAKRRGNWGVIGLHCKADSIRKKIVPQAKVHWSMAAFKLPEQ